ncbi:hypothetical protein [Roseofilum casamattae]|uniref:DALR anticodon binding domain-containing protein n=1 Tax=Roseofilum casamattae BLCC-M143 TaxID=3022442 RepID=A0ABT7BRZ5_9CYAN|nr:hypothetical protein [Roseofilum casamattae]MDJ1181962.1 hypothetical protein [Roseofilum casamattae BLCC-M143]
MANTDCNGNGLTMSFSIAQQLQDQLQLALAGLELEEGNCPPISVELLPENQRFGYRSPIALALAARSSHSAANIAERLLAQRTFSDGKIVMAPSGWIEWHLRDEAIATWLQAHLDNPFAIHPQWCSSIDPNAPQVFTWQAARARCCALLRLACDRKDIICDPVSLAWHSPSPVPWLRNGILQLHHPAERQLIVSLLHIVDTLSIAPTRPSRNRVAQLTQRLSEDWMRCDRHCRIWGTILQENPTLAIGRLAVSSVAGQTLKCLLERGLNLHAPDEL